MKKLNIGVVCYPTRGGSGIVAVETAHAMAERGHNVHVVSYAHPARLNSLLENVYFHPVRVPEYPLFEYPPYSMALAAQLAEVITRHKLDVLHAHYALPHAISAWLARTMAQRNDLPIVTTLHGTDVTIVGNDPSYLTVTKFSVESSDRVTTVSNWLSKRVSEVVGCDREDTEVVHNFVDTNIFYPHDTDLGRRLHQGGEYPVLLHMSNFRPVKRIGDVVDVFLKVREKMPVRLVMVGDGPDRSSAEAKLKASLYSDDVQFLGSQDSAEQILPAADVFLFPTNAESFGLAALEAMACGVPVIGANAGGLPEVVQDGVTGRLLAPGDTDNMASAVVDILSDRNKYKEMSAAARNRAETHFKPKKAIERYEAIYRESIEQIKRNGPRDHSGHIDFHSSGINLP
jgi:N-acetyl-alpha-D-glucosaminyl L-malate synthase BshA